MDTSTHRFTEALHDFKTGMTLVRHPEKENAWVDITIFDDVLKGCPTASLSGEDDYEIVSQPDGTCCSTPQETRKQRLHVTVAGHRGPFSR